MLLKVNNFILSVNFVNIDYEVDVDVPIVLGIPFLATIKALVDIERKDLKLE